MGYKLIRQSRKTVGIYIKNGAVEVRAPHGMPAQEIEKLAASKEKWIAEKLAASREQRQKKQEFSVSYGMALLWRGAEYPLLGDSDSAQIWRDEKGFHFPPGMEGDDLKYNVIRLYKICAKNHLVERVRHFAGIMGDMPSGIKVTEAKTRWGSCSKRVAQKTKNTGLSALQRMANTAESPHCNVNFSWRLCMAEDAVIDAVVVHELAHIQEMNHSPAFYAVVKAVLPDYDARDAKLKLLSKRLGVENWEL